MKEEGGHHNYISIINELTVVLIELLLKPLFGGEDECHDKSVQTQYFSKDKD